MDDAQTSNPILANLFSQNLWANLALIDACAALDSSVLDAAAPGTFDTIRTTLWHMIEIENRFLAALLSEANAGLKPLAGSLTGDLTTLRVYALGTGEGLVAWAESVSGDPILSGDWDDGPYHAPSSLFAAQAIPHAKEHHTQVQEALERAGIDAPDLDAWSWWDALRTVGMETSTI